MNICPILSSKLSMFSLIKDLQHLLFMEIYLVLLRCLKTYFRVCKCGIRFFSSDGNGLFVEKHVEREVKFILGTGEEKLCHLEKNSSFLVTTKKVMQTYTSRHYVIMRAVTQGYVFF